MDILIMQVFVSLLLVLGSVLLFLFSAKQRDFDHADRLALLPINDDDDNDKHKKESR
jgi:cbb3-type cytochrome oxidase maturation protein